MLQFRRLLAPEGLRRAKSAGKQNTSCKLLCKNALEQRTWIWAPATANRARGLHGPAARTPVGERRGVDRSGPIMGYVLPLIFWLQFSPAGT